MSLQVDLLSHSDFSCPTLAEFSQWVNTALDFAPKNISENLEEITIKIVDKTESQQLNETFRHKKGPTNILSFSYDQIPGFEQTSLGDLAICAEIVENEANSLNIDISDHWAHLTIHGTLHLLGYDHIEEDDAKIMEALEVSILKHFNIANPYLIQSDPINE